MSDLKKNLKIQIRKKNLGSCADNHTLSIQGLLAPNWKIYSNIFGSDYKLCYFGSARDLNAY